ncbi:transporter substrate-binding domain-containing protein [Rubrivivax gelatinosus]|uniref:transporter substrate-binding domain-containing protein n=1 Tax=Rubrivivax gelatinosus TaxID=28068 RepID=UPI001A926C9E|nr:transporter substrate-binding domain-containing protein [Rubrivivax gelatinosus]
MHGWRSWTYWGVSGLAALCIAAAPARAAERDVLKAGDVVTVGLVERFPPFHEWQPGQPAPTGMDVELLAELSRQTGLRFRYERFAEFPALQQALADGRVRLTTAVAQTPERALTLRFTRPYASVQQAFVGAAAITSVPATPDLSGRRVAVTRGYVTESIAAERFPSASRPAYANVTAALDAAERGDVDFVFEALPTLRTLLAERPRSHLAVLRTYGFPEGHLRLATGMRDAALVRQLDATLAALDPAFTKALRDKWLPPAPPPPPLPADDTLDVAPLRVGYLSGDLPFTTEVRPGVADGLGIRMMKEVAQRAGLQVASFQPMSLADGLEALADGRLDVMLGLTDIAERRDRMTFVGPYRANPLVLISPRQFSVWDLQQLAGQRLAMIRGYFGQPYIRAAYPMVDIVECTSFDDCLTLLEEGRAEAALYGLQGAYARLGPRSGSRLHITGTVPGLYDEHNLGLSLARATLAPRLRDALNAVLAEDMPRIEREWAQSEVRARVDWQRVRLSAYAAGAALLALALAWWWHSRTLRREIERTRRARQESEQYLAFLAHEVRNSLQSVSGAVALLRGSSPGIAERPLLDVLGRSSRATLGLLNALLDRHRLHEGRLALELRPESLERCLREAVDEIQPMAQAKGLALAFERRTPLDGWWRLDALRLQQVLRNLLVNAVKYTDSGQVTLAAGLEPSARGAVWRRLVIAVIDSGAGVAAASRERIFEPFHTEGGDRPGSGLGLGLSRDLVHAFGGTIEVDSAAGAGATFTLAFDLEAAEQPPQAAPGHVDRVLVVEDSPVYGLLLRQAFENLGIAVVLAETLEAARGALVESVAGAGVTTPSFDLVLCDRYVGDGEAGELLRFMRDAVRPGVRLPPVICMSAEVEPEAQARLLAAGAREVLAKESDVRVFVLRVLALLGQGADGEAAPLPGA